MASSEPTANVAYIYTWSKSQLEERKIGMSTMVEHERIQATEQVGLDGDRYAAKKGTYSGMNFTGQQVTLFDVSQFEEVCNRPRLQHAKLTISDLRRNIGLRCSPGTTLLSWIGHEIEIGTAVLFVTMHGNPCAALEKTLGAAGFIEAAWDMCGVHAEVLVSGTISRGDKVVVRPTPHPERITGPSTLRRQINGAYLRPCLQAKHMPDLVCSVDQTPDGYINACHYADSTGYRGSWPPDAPIPTKGPVARKIAEVEKKRAAATGDTGLSNIAIFLAGVALACVAQMCLSKRPTKLASY